ncbi:DNA-binding MarR family transcriptional regulator [Neorhizobium galegae]|uniref:MarR family winged helix-turn-helix transcriptional regulator n=1 Tax=Neorhizobium galegae TaxID=399 RepID=UPI001AE8DE8D|nr:MarR family transcriptional regulator [Neorhizobium galegae]MBP2547623.1 DNA-binding MarR family transcriptional regulator [Neorhizobium galegae]
MTQDHATLEPLELSEDIARIGHSMSMMRVMMGRRVIGRMAIARAAPGIDLSQLDILDAVNRITSDGGEPTVGAIAEAMRIDPSRGSRLVAELVTRGLLKRDASQEDGRRSLILLTPSGAAVLAEIRAVKHSIIESATADWSAEERTIFGELFERFIAGFYQAAQGTDRSECEETVQAAS